MEQKFPGYGKKYWYYKDAIVVSGISGKMPRSENSVEFKNNLYNKVPMTTSSEPRYPEGILGLPPNLGTLKNLTKFDASYFGVSPLQGNNMEVMHRISLEVSTEAMLDAGYDPDALRGKNIGVFLGCGAAETEEPLMNNTDNNSGYPIVGCCRSMFANRISYCFDLKGPSFVCDSACSSSALALHQAYLAIRTGLCDAAIVGGVTICMKPTVTYQFFNQKMLSPEGVLKCFDKDADGYVRSETVASMFIEKKCNAKRVYAELVHIDTNTDGGNKKGITYPSREMQASLMQTAYHHAQVDPAAIKYVEAHGTGTPAGDPEESASIAVVFLKEKRDKPLLIGSVKSNCGHSETASGLNAFFKIMYIFETGLIPPNINLTNINPNIEAVMDGRIKVVTEKTPFEGEYIGANSFGFGGVNVHTIFKRFEKPASTTPHPNIPRLALFCGRNEERLKQSLTEISEPVKSPEYYALLHEASLMSTAKMPYRGFSILNSTESGGINVEKAPMEKRPVWFVYSGMGSQWPGMATSMMGFDVFAESIRKSANLVKQFGIDLYKWILEGLPNPDEKRSIIPAFVSIASIQVALTDLLTSLDIKPDGIIGHSVGEIGCSYADGCFTAEEMVLAAYYRGRAVEDNDSGIIKGGMAAIGSSWEDAQKLTKKGIVRACDNSSDSITISGPSDEIKKCCQDLTAEGVFAREVDSCGYPFHSKYIQPASQSLKTSLNKLIKDPKKRSTKWICTSIPKERWGEPLAQYSSSDYHVNNLLSPVLFNDGVKEIPDNAIVIDIGPHCLLSSILKKSLPTTCDVIGLMKRKHPNNAHFFLENIGRLYTKGVDLKIQNIYPKVEFPVPNNTPPLAHLLPWDHSEDWYVPNWDDFGPFNIKNQLIIEIDMTKEENEFLFGHCIDDRILYPATGYLVLAWKAIAKSYYLDYTKMPVEFEDVTIHRATIMSTDETTTFKVNITPGTGNFEIQESNYIVVTGKVKKIDAFEPLEIKINQEESVLNTADIYKECRLRGYNYGPTFQLMTSSNIDGTSGKIRWENRWESFMDAMLHLSITRMLSRDLFVPVNLRNIKINPLKHETFENNMEIPIRTDKYTKATVAGGVEIHNIDFSPAPRKNRSNEPILESYQFIPYDGKVTDKNANNYNLVCNKLISKIVENSNADLKQFGHFSSANDALMKEYLDVNSNAHVLIKLLENILKVKNNSGNLSKAVESVLSEGNVTVWNDLLNATLLNERLFRTCLDVAIENLSSSDVKVCEINEEETIYNQAFHMLEKLNPFREIIYTVAHKKKDEKLPEEVSQLVWDFETANESFSKQDILIAKNISNENVLKVLRKSMKPKGFLVVIQRTSLTPAEQFLGNFNFKTPIIKSEKELESTFDKHQFGIICKNSCTNLGVVYLLRVIQNINVPMNIFKLDNSTYEEWVEKLKQTIKEFQNKPPEEKIWVYSENQSSGILGLVNCLRQEPGGDRIRCIFKYSKNSIPTNNFINKDLVMNVSKDGEMGSFRHLTLIPERFVNTDSGYVDLKTPGDLTSFEWFESRLKFNSSDTTDVYYSALNFRDVMLATGKLPSNAVPEMISGQTKSLLGFEYSGRNKKNERVMGMIYGESFATKVEVDEAFMWKVPDHWSLEEAATVPVVYSTVYYALIIRGNMQPGDSVLIHSGSGGIGQAAIRVALSMGCTVYTTVGSEQKKNYLKELFPQLEDEHFSDSRSLKFEKDIMMRTNGKGVDHVLNSLAEDKLQASIRCLALNGNFLEIGKFDLSKNSLLGMKHFLKNISFHGILLDSVIALRSDKSEQRIRNLVKEGIESGVVQPLKATVFDKTEIEEAFRFMASGKHIGKVLIKIREEKSIVSSPFKLNAISKSYCDPVKSYIITGGLGGFGLELAHWLIKLGAMKLVLTSRTGIRTGYQNLRVHHWKKFGIKVEVLKYDAADENQCLQLLKEASALGPVGGIFNLAMVLRDAFFENQTPKNFHEVCSPKALGIQNLDKLSRKVCPELHWFVAFSSVSCGRGNAGQTNYGFANSVMERVCEERAKIGLPGTAIQWGVVGDVGIVQEQLAHKILEMYLPQKINSCISILGQFLSINEPVVSSYVAASKNPQQSVSGGIKSLSKSVAHILGIKDISNINLDMTLEGLGLDSLMTVETQKTLERNYEILMSGDDIRKLTFNDILNLEKQKDETVEEDLKIDSLDIDISNFMLPKESALYLNSKRKGRIVFMFPPIEGNTNAYNDVGQLLDCQVVGLQHTADMNENTIDKLSDIFLETVRRIQPKGPYSFFGYSLGSIYAYEVTWKLKKLGEEVERLIFLDGSPFLITSNFDLHNRDGVQTMEEKETYGLAYLVHESVSIDMLKARNAINSIKVFEDKVHCAGDIIHRASNKMYDIKAIKQSIRTHFSKLFAVHIYKPTVPISNDILLFKAKDGLSVKESLAEDYDIHKICSGKTSVYTVDGTHTSFLAGVGAKSIVDTINKM